jgi:hypothetical protein
MQECYRGRFYLEIQRRHWKGGLKYDWVFTKWKEERYSGYQDKQRHKGMKQPAMILNYKHFSVAGISIS